jgi:hypothetical protein
MQVPPSLFGPWHDFYMLIGTASATLVGLMFVAASVGTGIFTAERQVGLRTFLSPTVVAFSVVLGTSLIGVLPASGWRVPGLLLVGIGLLGIVYSWRVWRRMLHGGIVQRIDFEDRVWYTMIPAMAYFVLAMAGGALGIETDVGCAILATGVCLLLLAGIRNAWDMTTWIVLRREG